ncbi:hypothetical protein ACOME3_000952 [Neoechinorhynchus agilis]
MDPLTTQSLLFWGSRSSKKLPSIHHLTSPPLQPVQNGNSELATSDHETIFLWRRPLTSQPLSPFCMFNVPSNTLGCIRALKFIDQFLLLSAHENGLALWDTKQLVCVQHHVYAGEFVHIEPLVSSQRATTFFCSDGSQILQFNLKDLSIIRRLRTIEPRARIQNVKGLFAFSKPKGDSVVVIALIDGYVRLWSFNDESPLLVCESDHQVIRNNGRYIKQMNICRTKPRYILFVQSKVAFIVDAINFEEVAVYSLEEKILKLELFSKIATIRHFGFFSW